MTVGTRKKTATTSSLSLSSAVKKAGSGSGTTSFKKQTSAAPVFVPSRHDQIKGLVEEIRTWRDDSFSQRLYQSALFWAEKIVSMAGIVVDLFRSYV